MEKKPKRVRERHWDRERYAYKERVRERHWDRERDTHKEGEMEK